MKKYILTIFLTGILWVSGYAQSTQSYNYVKEKQTIELTKSTFLERVVNYTQSTEWNYIGDKPCIIDFYTTWCGPCKRLAPILEDVAAEYKGKIYVYKIDAEKEVELAKLFGVRSYPTLVFCPMTGNPSVATGLQPKENLDNLVKRILLPEERDSLTQ